MWWRLEAQGLVQKWLGWFMGLPTPQYYLIYTRAGKFWVGKFFLTLLFLNTQVENHGPALV
jgi:hypothetical protein